MTIPAHLIGECSTKDLCREATCTDAVKQDPAGRWFITMGHAGFNAPKNNGTGYATAAEARGKIKFYLGR